jgi:D-alanyl-lipoteichoic acid acyltransferase DltB (MBOAT superfamily)
LLFNSTSYLIFLPLIVLAYYQLTPSGRRWLLLVASYVFYAISALTIFPPDHFPQWSRSHWWHEVLRIGSLHTSLILSTTLFNYWVGRKIGAAPGAEEGVVAPGSRPATHSHHMDTSKLPNASSRRFWLILGLVVNLTVLSLYKYAGFFSVNIAALFHGGTIQPLNWILPLGISFYTFEVISYLVDVYQGMTRPIRSLLDMALYVSFFPHLIAGPIIRSEDLVPQLTADRPFLWENIRTGIGRFIWGMVKKIYVADVMAKIAAETYAGTSHASGSALLLGTYAFAVQIYCDFSAYSDMAIGSAQMLGIKLPENFDMPYISCSIREFWRRWHISLSTWLRDYLYIPLGGSRKGNVRTYANLMLTMLLGGFWHGAGWNWILWGAMQGGMMCGERALNISEKPPKSLPWKLVRWLVTFHLVCASWILFRARDLTQAGEIFKRILTRADGDVFVDHRPLVYLAILLLADVLGMRMRMQGMLNQRPALARWATYGAVALFVLTFQRASNPEFIYFQF